ncbi:MAG: hypothetical protein N2D54_06285, partial [Chloroflexota bacterium]
FKNINKINIVTKLMVSMLLIAVLSLSVASPAFAAAGDNDPIVGPGDVYDGDLFLDGNHIKMEGTVLGDLFAAGDNVIIDGNVEGNLFVVGQIVQINGVVDGSTFAFGEDVTIAGSVGGSLITAGYGVTLAETALVTRNTYFAGFSLVTEVDSTIDRNLYAAGYQNVLNGQINRNVDSAVSAFEMNGTVGGDVYVELQEMTGNGFDRTNFYGVPTSVNVQVVDPGMRIDEHNVNGQVEYNVNYVRIDAPNSGEFGTFIETTPGFYVTNLLRKRVGEFFALLIIGSLIIWRGFGAMQNVAQEMHDEPVPSILWGFLTIVLYPIALLMAISLVFLLILLLSVATLGTLTGTVIQLGFLLIGSFSVTFGVIISLVTKAIVAYMIGKWALQKTTPAMLDNNGGNYWALVLGAMIYEIIRAIPLGFGMIASILVIFLGTGAILTTLRNGNKPLAIES